MPVRTLAETMYRAAAVAVMLGLLAAVGFILWRLEPMRWVDFVLHRDTQPLLFIALWAVLPVLGFPMTIFLVLAGLKFGIIWGIVLTALVMPVHMTASFVLAKSYLAGPLRRFAAARGHPLPDLSSQRVIGGMLVFVSLPGPSYALKNYLLALVDIPYRTYLGLNWLIQGLIQVPIIGMSGAAGEKDWRVFGLFVLLVLVLLALRWRFKKRREASQAKDPPG